MKGFAVWEKFPTQLTLLSLNLSPPGHGRPPWWEAWVLRHMARDPGKAFRLSD